MPRKPKPKPTPTQEQLENEAAAFLANAFYVANQIRAGQYVREEDGSRPGMAKVLYVEDNRRDSAILSGVVRVDLSFNGSRFVLPNEWVLPPDIARIYARYCAQGVKEAQAAAQQAKK